MWVRKIKSIFLVTITIMLVAFMAACGGNQNNNVATQQTQGSAQVKTFVDLCGNEIKLPAKINRVLITSIWPLPAVYAYHQSSVDKLIGIPQVSQAAAKSSVLGDIYPQLLNLPTNFVDGTEINIEEIIKLKPDIVFYTGERQEEYQKLSQAGIPAVGFTTAMKGNGDVTINIDEWMQQLDKIFGENGKSKQLSEYNKTVANDNQAKIGSIDQGQKPKILIIFSHSDAGLKVAGKGHYSDYWIDASGGVNVATDVDKLKDVNMEQISKWNPDIIYITNFGTTTSDDILQNKIKGYDWSAINAVKNKRVFKMPLGTYRLYAPSVENSLLLTWMSANNYPDKFKEFNQVEYAKKVYKDLFNYDLKEQDIKDIFNSLNEKTQAH